MPKAKRVQITQAELTKLINRALYAGRMQLMENDSLREQGYDNETALRAEVKKWFKEGKV